MIKSNDMIKNLKEKTINSSSGSGQVLIGLFTGIAIYALIESRTFGENAAVFPRFIAIVMLTGIFIWLIRDYLPESLRKGFTESSTITEVAAGGSDSERLEVDDDKEDVGTDPSVIGFIIGYIGLCYLIGFLFASPIFVFVYSMWTKQPWYILGALPTLAGGLVYLFMWLSGANLVEGLLV